MNRNTGLPHAHATAQTAEPLDPEPDPVCPRGQGLSLHDASVFTMTLAARLLSVLVRSSGGEASNRRLTGRGSRFEAQTREQSNTHAEQPGQP